MKKEVYFPFKLLTGSYEQCFYGLLFVFLRQRNTSLIHKLTKCVNHCKMQRMQQFNMHSRDYSGKGMVHEVSVSFLKVSLRLQINLKRDSTISKS